MLPSKNMGYFSISWIDKNFLQKSVLLLLNIYLSTLFFKVIVSGIVLFHFGMFVASVEKSRWFLYIDLASCNLWMSFILIVFNGFLRILCLFQIEIILLLSSLDFLNLFLPNSLAGITSTIWREAAGHSCLFVEFWSCCMILFIYCWIWFVSISWRIFVFIDRRY